MNSTLLTLSLTLISCALGTVSLAAPTKAPTSKVEYCSRLNDASSYQRQIENSYNQLAFTNQPGLGLLGQGVCWWHSLFTRNATYFALYRPDLPKADIKTVRRIIDLIYAGRGVVTVPGYNNLYEFSLEWAEEIADKLERAQVADGTLGFAWIRGLSGRSIQRPEKLEDRMDELYNLVKNEGQIIYQKLQMPGITAHSWLVTNMRRTSTGYVLTVVDSNFPRTREINYTRGDNALDYFGMTHFIPYTSRNKDWQDILARQTKFCSSDKTSDQPTNDRRTARR